MSKRYDLGDFAGVKPRVVPRRCAFGDRVYTWYCSDTSSGSRGHGTTPKDAYNVWLRNYRRREAFYRRQAEHTRLVLTRLARVK